MRKLASDSMAFEFKTSFNISAYQIINKTKQNTYSIFSYNYTSYSSALTKVTYV